MKDNYTRYPRAILWLLREGEVRIGGAGGDTEPPFIVTVKPFYLSKVPITNEQFAAYRPQHRPAGVSPGPDDPAVGVSLHDAAGYCAWYAEVSRKPMRLPTEVEWEYACRGGSDSRYFFGDDSGAAAAYVWDHTNSGGRVPNPGQKKANPFGLHSMLGCVWEWTSSLYRPYPAIEDDGRDDLGAPGARVLRGGSFRDHVAAMGSAIRRAEEPGMRLDDVGFRVARSL